MVCKFDPVRMAAMVRLLTSGSHVEITAEEAIQEKIAVQIINREFHDANEANLLEEKDMHVFDSRPLTDPLYLVRCNACAKPIKSSQYASHAERCRALNPLQEIGMEPDSTTGNKKPLKKGRKNLQNGHGYQGMTIGELEKSDSIDGDVAVSEFNSRPSIEGTSALNDANKVVIPAPLATKMYYSQGTHRLRVAISHLYHQSVANDACSCSNSIPTLAQDNGIVSSSAGPGKLMHSMQKDSITHQKVSRRL